MWCHAYYVFVIASIFVQYGYPMNIKKSQFDTIVIFGDSNSDTGNIYNMTRNQMPPIPYYQGRFSNGPIWVDKLNVSSLINYAHGGATTDNDFVQGSIRPLVPRVPGVRQQIKTYMDSMNTSDIDFYHTLYVVWAGGNDYLGNRTLSPLKIVNSLSNASEALIMFGAKHLVLVNQPPLQIIPYFQTFNSNISLSNLTNQYNDHLLTNIRKLQGINTVMSLKVFDLHSLITKILVNASVYAFTSTNSSCWYPQLSVTTVCKNPESYVFFDDVHFTTRMHELIAEEFRPFTSVSGGNHVSMSFLAICVWILLAQFSSST
ncbi:unnamed protein product [Rotaria socialis]|uniref:Uncharacterized protein n=2 Tax=Rotaria socialis TaxID=392032 RepID=A0A818BW77_9BILA|nr:unnamed protein product [Rotaria socialis]